jgi:hypothetical protein
MQCIVWVVVAASELDRAWMYGVPCGPQFVCLQDHCVEGLLRYTHCLVLRGDFETESPVGVCHGHALKVRHTEGHDARLCVVRLEGDARLLRQREA